MAAGKNPYRILVAGANDKICGFITEILPKGDYEISFRAETAGLARRRMLEAPEDLVIINAPLREEFGTQLALDLADTNAGVLLLVPGEVFEQACAKVEDEGVLTLAKPVSRQGFYGAVKLLTAMREKLMRLERQNRALQEKMMDIRTVNRAKWLLIERMKMTEQEAHYFIEKQAMDLRVSRREMAENIIRAYDMG